MGRGYLTESLHTRFRPKSFDDVVGQDGIVASLRTLIKEGSAQAFLFCGPSGVGKTTLSRICATELECQPSNVIEVDAATCTDVDTMRAIQRTLDYAPFTQSKNRAVIIDECHRLSAQARDSLLKSIEEPPKHVYWFLCTTECNKVPKTIKTRCASYTLKPVDRGNLEWLADYVCDEAGFDTPGDVIDLCVREASGSPRQLLSNLAVCQDVKHRKEAADLLRTVADTEPVRELCQFLINGGSWATAMKLIAKLEGLDPEGVRLMVVSYMAKVAMSAKGDKVVGILRIIEAFRADAPFNPSEKLAPIIAAIGRAIYAD